MKSLCSPLALAFNSSHEALNPYHRMSGRIIYGFLMLHGAFYLNFFIQSSILLKRLRNVDVILGLLALSLLTILMSTAVRVVRRWSYRIFFICHLIIGVLLLPVIFFHVTHLRIYVSECLAIFVLDLVARKLDTIMAFTKITAVPDTSLVKLSMPVPASKMARFAAAPGQHVYLSIPYQSASSPIHQLLFNPFSIASISDNTITLVLRVLHGPTTTALSNLTKLSKANPPLKIEGPYGSSRHFPNFAANFDRILLVAGGVGATFILPIFRDIEEALASEGLSTRKVKMVWSVKTRADIAWSDVPKTLDNESNLKVFTTGIAGSAPVEGTGVPYDAVEMRGVGEGGRPDLRRIVDDTFRLGEEDRVAVLVCGPEGMARELTGYVSHWVEKGRYVWFHDESFGW